MEHSSINITMVSIPVKDQDKALKFYTEKLGFKLETDAAFGDQRWIELSIPGTKMHISLFTVPGQEDRVGTFSNIVYSCKDIQKVYETLKSRGVEFTEPPKKQSWGGVTALFKDADNNTFCISEEQKKSCCSC